MCAASGRGGPALRRSPVAARHGGALSATPPDTTAVASQDPASRPGSGVGTGYPAPTAAHCRRPALGRALDAGDADPPGGADANRLPMSGGDLSADVSDPVGGAFLSDADDAAALAAGAGGTARDESNGGESPAPRGAAAG